MMATVENMRACSHVSGVVMLDSLGNEFSANPGDYFMHGDGPLLDENDEPMVLARRTPVPAPFVEPLA